jgi:prefoldin subunit 5
MESLVTFQQQRIEALEEHIQMLENECNALYSQINECDCRLTVAD